MSHGTVYVLELEKNKYYVGHTKDTDLKRILDHGNTPQSARWTQVYKPVQIVRTVPGSTCDEDRITLHAMEVFGWQNVRGGKWCRVEMENPPRELFGTRPSSSLVCERCQRAGHEHMICLWPIYPDGDAIFTE